MKSGENWKVVSQKTFKDLNDFIHVLSLRARADTSRGNILIVTNFNHTV